MSWGNCGAAAARWSGACLDCWLLLAEAGSACCAAGQGNCCAEGPLPPHLACRVNGEHAPNGVTAPRHQVGCAGAGGRQPGGGPYTTRVTQHCQAFPAGPPQPAGVVLAACGRALAGQYRWLSTSCRCCSSISLRHGGVCVRACPRPMQSTTVHDTYRAMVTGGPTQLHMPHTSAQATCRVRTRTQAVTCPQPPCRHTRTPQPHHSPEAMRGVSPPHPATLYTRALCPAQVASRSPLALHTLTLVSWLPDTNPSPGSSASALPAHVGVCGCGCRRGRGV